MDESDDEAETFCRGIHPRLVGAMSLYCGDGHLAEELAQEAILVIWQRWPKVRAAASPEAYAHRVAFNVSASFFRRRAAERRARQRLEVSPVRLPDRAAALDVRLAVAALPPRQRQAVVLRYYLDLPIAEVAATMSCAEGTVKAHLHKATEALRLEGVGSEEEIAEHG